MYDENLPQPEDSGQEKTSESPPPPSGTLKFLDFLFEGMMGGFVEFRYFGAGPKPKVVDRSTYLSLPINHARVIAEVLSRNVTQMITVGPAPRCRIPTKGEGKDYDVLKVNCIWADLDYKHAQGGAIEVIRRIRQLALPPSVVINSGYGRHVYYVFNEVLSVSQLPEWAKLIQNLRDVLQGDAVTNISRVLRLPGSFNIKEAEPVLCEICEDESSWNRYGFEQVKETLQKSVRPDNSQLILSQLRELYPIKDPGRFEKALFAIHRLDDYDVPRETIMAIFSGKRTIRTGANAGREDDESGRDFWIVCTLLEKGVDEEDIKDIFRTHPEGCGSKWARPQHGEAYLELTLQKAREKVTEKKNRQMIDTEDEKEEEVIGGWEERIPPSYRLGADGSIWYCPPVPDNSRKPRPPVIVCNSFMRISEIHEHVDTGQLSAVIEFKYGEAVKTTTILRSQMVEARSLVAALGGAGAPVTSNNARAVISYLSAYEHAFLDRIPRKKVTNRFGRGRNDGPFYLPGMASDVEFAPTGAGDASLYRAFASRKGTLQDWENIVNLVAADSMIIPQVAICAALVPPLQSKLQIPNFILDINGTSGSGKSITAKLAASVWGKPKEPDSIILPWEATKVAIEQIASMCSDLPVFLDDAQHVPDDMKRSVIYMIANGKGRARGAKAGGIRDTTYWHTVCISTSEHPLHESSPHEGARARLLPVGGLAVRPFPRGMKSFVDSIDRAVSSNHGLAGELLINHIRFWNESQWYAWQQRYATIRQTLSERATSDIVGRVSEYIAAIQLAAEIGRSLFCFRFGPEHISRWLMSHLEDQQKAQNHVALALQALGDFYVTNRRFFYGSEPYALLENPAQLLGAVKRDLFVGFLTTTIQDVFNKRKWNTTALLNKFAAEKVLYAPDAGHHTKKVSVDGEKPRMVCIHWRALFPDGGGEGEDIDAATISEIKSGVTGF
ncbi:MAG TPA: DUF927 domain-containing protein [Pyrinomonadaceae bacterium]|jgi:hypothetical protein